MAITEFGGTVPSSTDPDNFDSRADAAWAWLVSAVPEMNAAIQLLNLNSVRTVSATSHSAALGIITFTIENNKSFVDGMWVTIASAGTPAAVHMVAIVTNYLGTTLEVNVQWHSGFVGSYSDWVIVQAPPYNTNAINDEIFLSGGNGCGATNTLVRRLTTVVINSGGSSMTYADSATLGMSLTINQAGIYQFNAYNADSSNLLLTRNTVTPSFGSADTLSFASVSSGSGANNTTVVIKCNVSDVIRMCVGSTTAGTSSSTYFRAKRIL